MDLQQIGTGAGGGLLGAVVAFFGLSRRIDRQERDMAIFRSEVAMSIAKLADATTKAIDDIKDDNKSFAARVVFRDTCAKCEQHHDSQLQGVVNVQKEIKDNITSAMKEMNTKFNIVMENFSRRREDVTP